MKADHVNAAHWPNNFIFRITFNGEQVLYSGRMLESPNYVKCRQANKIVPTITFGPVKPNDW